VGVHIDEPGRDDHARGIDDFLALQRRFRDGRDAIASDANVHLAVEVGRRIDHSAALQDDVVVLIAVCHGLLPIFQFLTIPVLP
jgi:hypothetical protein